MRFAYFIIASVMVFVALGGSLLYLSGFIDECETYLGSFAEELSPQLRQSCAQVTIFFGLVVLAWIFSGFNLAGFIIAESFLQSKNWGIITSTAAVAISFNFLVFF